MFGVSPNIATPPSAGASCERKSWPVCGWELPSWKFNCGNRVTLHCYATGAIRNRVPLSHSVTTQHNSPVSPLAATPTCTLFLWTVSVLASQSRVSRTTLPCVHLGLGQHRVHLADLHRTMPRHQASEKPTVSGATRIITSIDTRSPNPEQSAPPVIIWFGVVQHGELGFVDSACHHTTAAHHRPVAHLPWQSHL